MTKCAQCRKPFTKLRMTMKVCGAECGEIYGRKVALEKAEKAKRIEAKRDRLETRERKEALKPKGKIEAELQRIVNACARERDRDQPCVSCGTNVSASWEAGHYVSVGANKTIRFELDNIHKQCHRCNNYNGGNSIPYRINLIKKIGLERVEWLEGPHKPKHYTKEDLQVLKSYFREKLKELQRVR